MALALGSGHRHSDGSDVKVLVVEDHEEHAKLVRDQLTRADRGIEVEHVSSLEAAQHALDGSPDVIVLDLGLPDAQRLESVHELQDLAPEIPTVVLSSADDRDLVIDALRAGAEDYLVKGVDGPTLLDTLERAIARHRHLVDALDHVRRAESDRRHLLALEELSPGGSSTPVTSRQMGALSLREASPDAFAEILRQYLTVLDLALEAQVYGRDRTETVNRGLRELAAELGSLLAGPRDVVDVHTSALRTASRDTTPQRLDAYIEEGRTVLLKLMGDLVSHYRRFVGTRTRSEEAGTA